MLSARAFAWGLAIAAMAAPYHARVVARDLAQQPDRAAGSNRPEQSVRTRSTLPAPSVGTVGAGASPTLAPYGSSEMQSFPAAPVATETIGAPVTAPAESAGGPRKVQTLTVRRDAAQQGPAASGHRTNSALRKHTVRPSRTARAPKSRVRAAARPSARSGAIARRPAKPLVLTASQRRAVYDAIVKHQATASADGPRVIPPTALSGYAVLYPEPAATASASAAAGPSVPVGTAVPARARIAPVPPPALKRVPQARRYSYAMVNNRVVLVDPVTSVIVADVTP